jgi:predicted SAM-dependent methyltransferase
MDKLPYLNLGCGSHFNLRWVNVDFLKTGDDVIAHNLLKGVPFDDNSFEVVYHSHVLEHFQKNDAPKFIAECYRVLKPGGTIRIAVPDLEQIVNNYNRLLAMGKADPGNEKIRDDYEWIKIEMYDQTVRNVSGGEMVNYLSRKTLPNEDFILQRIGNEGYLIRQEIIRSMNNPETKMSRTKKKLDRIKRNLSFQGFKYLLLKTLFNREYKLMDIGKFRKSGEIHQWMYDIYSLGNLLKDAGFRNLEQKRFDESSISGWRSFGLDEVDNTVRKPDSLFVEATK